MLHALDVFNERESLVEYHCMQRYTFITL